MPARRDLRRREVRLASVRYRSARPGPGGLEPAPALQGVTVLGGAPVLAPGGFGLFTGGCEGRLADGSFRRAVGLGHAGVAVGLPELTVGFGSLAQVAGAAQQLQVPAALDPPRESGVRWSMSMRSMRCRLPQ